MDFKILVLKNVFNLPLLCFIFGIIITIFKSKFRLPSKINKLITVFILFCVGLKGGAPLAEHGSCSTGLFSVILVTLLVWGFIQPIFSFYLLKRFTQLDLMTAAAVAASFGSVSVMTFITGIAFLDQLQTHYEPFLIAILAIMEIPAIITGLSIAKKFDQSLQQTSPLQILKESLLNKAVLAIVLGLTSGAIFHSHEMTRASSTILAIFKPLLCLFLFDMGLHVGRHREQFRSISWPVNLFALYMPLIGGGFGLLMSYLLGLAPGTGTLIALLTASASYIAVPAAMRIALPQAKEAIYLPLSLGIAFPFNVIVGIPLYYHLAGQFLR